MVKWLDTDEPVKKEDIEHVEKEFGIRFPKDYAEYAMQNHGGVPDPNSFDFEGRKGAVFERLLSYVETQPDYILKEYRSIKTRLPRKVYPIGSDPFGNYICFSYRENESNPCIVFWDHEKASPKTAIWYYPHTVDSEKSPSGKMDKSTELPEGIFLWRKKGKHSNGTHWKPKRKRSAFIWKKACPIDPFVSVWRSVASPKSKTGFNDIKKGNRW